MDTAARHLRDLRPPSGDPPIILVPGIDGTALLFYRQQPLLSERFDTISFPLPTVSPPTMTMDTLVRDLASLIEEVSSTGAILLGESFGGALSMSVALQRPDLVRGLVIVNSFPYFDERLKLRTVPWFLRSIPWAAMPIVRRYTSSHLHSSHTNDEDIAEFRERAKSIDRDSYIRRLQILVDYDIRERLDQIAAPTLFLAGDRDRLLPSVRWGNYMRDRVPQSSLTVLEGYGHVCLIDHDLDLTEYVVPWFDESCAEEPGE
jgi:3-oxoadipate enol-lactonase